jgi:large subunit ribosomal protein L10
MRDAGAKFRVTKNRLAKIAIKGSKFEQLADQFSGPTAIAVSEDPVAAAKVVSEFAKTNDKLVILGGALGEKMLDAAGVAALAKLPSLDDLRSKLIGVLQAPAGKLASVVQAPAAQLARVLSAYGRTE